MKKWRPYNISQLRRRDEWTFIRFKVPREFREILEQLIDKVPMEGENRRAEMDGYLIVDALRYLLDHSPHGLELVHQVGYRPIGEGQQAPVIRLAK